MNPIDQIPLTQLKGIGEKTAALFAKLNISTVEDLIRYYPRSYETFEEPVEVCRLKADQVQSARLQVTASPSVARVGNMKIVRSSGRDATGSIQLCWFNMAYLKNTLAPGSVYIFRGRVSRKKNGMVMEQPLMYSREHYETLLGHRQPIYGLTKGLTSKMISKAVAQSLEKIPVTQEYLPEWIRGDYHLAEWNFAIREIHFPKDGNSLALARRRLVFDEFFFFLLRVERMKRYREKKLNPFDLSGNPMACRVLGNLPYGLTGAQDRTLGEIFSDMEGEGLMNRLVQGDVGSGKTIIAFLALLKAAEHGFQGALMAPTEVLSKQHYEALIKLIEENGLPIHTQLLTGSMTAKEKRLACERIRNHEADIVIGTHALIQEGVEFDCLALAVTDEQHRFGVHQRELLGDKGQSPHVLVMSATPIPRTLAIILYGDLDISVIDELPANRLPVKNCVIGSDKLENAYRFIWREVEKGHQAYVVCAMVEESQEIEAENVTDYTNMLREQLPGIRIECLHGRMKAKEKNQIMEAFAAGKILVLVSTTVVEVGVNVPNATVMMVENAERFGLAQLHQLRGRVGRGEAQSYCIFINRSGSKESEKRLEILIHSNDGFHIASEDLKLRGPGDFFGVRQSGMMEFRLGDIYTDAGILREAAEAAAMVVKRDPMLSLEEHCPLRRAFAGESWEDHQKVSL